MVKNGVSLIVTYETTKDITSAYAVKSTFIQ